MESSGIDLPVPLPRRAQAGGLEEEEPSEDKRFLFFPHSIQAAAATDGWAGLEERAVSLPDDAQYQMAGDIFNRLIESFGVTRSLELLDRYRGWLRQVQEQLDTEVPVLPSELGDLHRLFEGGDTPITADLAARLLPVAELIRRQFVVRLYYRLEYNLMELEPSRSPSYDLYALQMLDDTLEILREVYLLVYPIPGAGPAGGTPAARIGYGLTDEERFRFFILYDMHRDRLPELQARATGLLIMATISSRSIGCRGFQ
jgi:hypothetical protein